jgi:phosphoribosyl 1,2-cyclic phosphodiesterase
VTRVKLWGIRGSLASPGADTARYGGNTSCVEVRGAGGTVLVLDAGTGIRGLGNALTGQARRVHLLLTHLHMDHIQGLGFFAPLFDADVEVHLWGPGSTTLSLKARLNRYLSPPLFPVHLRDLPRLTVHELPRKDFTIGEFRISSALVCHPGPTVGYRIAGPGHVFAYLPDHEPALGVRRFPLGADWTSGHTLARGVDLLIHDAQYTGAEYLEHLGWGHCSVDQALAFAGLAKAKRLVTFHHDPAHGDEDIDRLTAAAVAAAKPRFPVTAGAEGAVFELDGG